MCLNFHTHILDNFTLLKLHTQYNVVWNSIYNTPSCKCNDLIPLLYYTTRWSRILWWHFMFNIQLSVKLDAWLSQSTDVHTPDTLIRYQKVDRNWNTNKLGTHWHSYNNLCVWIGCSWQLVYTFQVTQLIYLWNI